MIINNLNCCGIKELIGFQNKKKSIKKILKETCTTKYYINHSGLLKNTFGNAYFIYSITNRQSPERGNKLANAIHKYKLGTVIKAPTAKNPNSKNELNVWLWRINQQSLKKWYRNELKKPQKELNKLLEEAEIYDTQNPTT